MKPPPQVSRRRDTSKAPRTDADDPLPPPNYLTPAAAEVWRRTVTHLVALGTVNVADETTLETFVAAVLRQRRISRAIEDGPLTEDGKISPLLRVAEATAATVKNLGHVLGLNPTARQRLPKAPQKVGGGKWQDLD